MPLPQSASAQPASTDFPMEDLRSCQGCWVAYNPDGSRLVARAETLAALEAKLRARGVNPEEVLLEPIPKGVSILSGSELS